MSTGSRVLTQKPGKRHHIGLVKLPAHVSHWDIWSTTCFSATPSLVSNPSCTLLLIIAMKSYWFPVLKLGEVLTLIFYEFPFSVELMYVLCFPRILSYTMMDKGKIGQEAIWLDLIKMKAWNCHKIKILLLFSCRYPSIPVAYRQQ